MTNRFIIFLCILCFTNLTSSQEWMTSLDIAQKLASVQNKMVLMVWEETTKYPYPILINDSRGRIIFIEDLFVDENISPLIWKYFVPVIVSEDKYAALYKEAKGKRNKLYISRLNDDGIKIIDVNGYILNVNAPSLEYQNITTLVGQYGLNTDYISTELRNYSESKNFYSAYYLASKYLEFSLYVNKKVRKEIINLSSIYLEEALVLLALDNVEDQQVLKQRAELLMLQKHLVLKRPRKVIRQLKRMDAETVNNTNKSFVAFLYYVAFMSLDDLENAEIWKSEISLVDLRKARMLINLNS
jgi:hypothetical protein